MTPAVRKEMRALWPELTMRQIAHRYRVSPRTVWTALRGVAHQRRKMDDQEVLDMRAAYPGMTVRQIASRWGYSYNSVRKALTGETHKHLGGAHTGNNRRSGHDIAAWMAAHRATRKVNVREKLILARL